MALSQAEIEAVVREITEDEITFYHEHGCAPSRPGRHPPLRSPTNPHYSPTPAAPPPPLPR